MNLDLSALQPYYESLGLYCRLKEPTYDWGHTLVTVSDRPDFVLSTNIDMTGIEYAVNYSGDNVDLRIIVVAKKDRNKGMANKLLKPIFELAPEVVTLRDESNGFWEHIKDKYPEIDWRIELEECMSEEQIDIYFPSGFDPTKRDGGVWPDRHTEGWLCASNPDDYDSMLWQIVIDWAKEHNDITPETIGEIASNAWWAGYHRGLLNGRKE
jgi:hypothetical protein